MKPEAVEAREAEQEGAARAETGVSPIGKLNMEYWPVRRRSRSVSARFKSRYFPLQSFPRLNVNQ